MSVWFVSLFVLLAAKCGNERPSLDPPATVRLQVNPSTVTTPPPPSVRVDTFWRVVNGDSLMALVEVPVCPVCPPIVVVDTAAIEQAERERVLSQIDSLAIYAVFVDSGSIRAQYENELRAAILAEIDTAAILALYPPDTVRLTEYVEVLAECPACPEPEPCPDCPEPQPEPTYPDYEPFGEWWWPEGDWTFAQEDSIIAARGNFVLDSLGLPPDPSPVQYVSWSTKNWFRFGDATGQGLHSYLNKESFAWWLENPPIYTQNCMQFNYEPSKLQGFHIQDSLSVGLTTGDYTVLLALGGSMGTMDTTRIKPYDVVYLVVEDGRAKVYHNETVVSPQDMPFTLSNTVSGNPKPFDGTLCQFAYFEKALTPREQWRMKRMVEIYRK